MVAQRETEEDVAIAGGEEEREAEEEADPAGRLQQVLFPELISSDEDSDDSDWIVGDLDDYSEVEKAFCHIEVRFLYCLASFPYSISCVCVHRTSLRKGGVGRMNSVLLTFFLPSVDLCVWSNGLER